MRIRSLVACSAAAALAVPIGLAGSAPASVIGRASAEASGAATTVPTGRSTTFAGLQVKRNFTNTKVSSSFKAPKLTCGKPEAAIDLSVGIQIGTATNDVSSAGLFAGCVNGKARFFPVLIVNGSEKSYTGLGVHTAELIRLALSEGPGGTTVSFEDKTTGKTKKRTGVGATKMFGPWVGADAFSTSTGLLPVPNFGTVTFLGATLNGAPFGSQGSLVFLNRYDANRTSEEEIEAVLVNEAAKHFYAVRFKNH